MSVITSTFGSTVTPAVTALQSLANAAFWKSALITFSTNNPVWVQFQLKLSTANSGAGLAAGYANLFLACSTDNTTWDSSISAGDAAWTNTTPSVAEQSKGFLLVGRMSMSCAATTTQVHTKSFFIPPGSVPRYGIIVVENACGKTLLSSGNAVYYIENTYTIT